MKIIKSNNEEKYIFGTPKNWFQITNGDLCITYNKEQRVYILTRIDNKKFDGTEDLDAIFVGNFKKPTSLEEVIEYEVNLLASSQLDLESDMFVEFDWTINDSKTEIIIYPIFFEKGTITEMNLGNHIGEFESVSVSDGCKKLIRNKISK